MIRGVNAEDDLINESIVLSENTMCCSNHFKIIETVFTLIASNIVKLLQFSLIYYPIQYSLLNKLRAKRLSKFWVTGKLSNFYNLLNLIRNNPLLV